MYTYIGNDTFVIHHYAASVTYSIHEFCEKNKDLLIHDVVIMMQVAKCVLDTLIIILNVFLICKKPYNFSGM